MSDELDEAIFLDPNVTEGLYDDLDAAAMAVLRRIAGGEKNEWAGVLYQLANGKYASTAPRQMGNNHAFKLRLKAPKSVKLSGIYHTHPDAPEANENNLLFSEPDVQMALGLNVPSFLRTMPTNDIRRFDPTDKRRVAGNASKGAQRKFSQGRLLTDPAAIAALTAMKEP